MTKSRKKVHFKESSWKKFLDWMNSIYFSMFGLNLSTQQKKSLRENYDIDVEDEIISLRKEATPPEEKSLRVYADNNSVKNSNTFMDLKKVCPFSGECLAFGFFSKSIYLFFRRFNLAYANLNNIKLLNEGANGFVNEIEFEKEDYRSYAVLKSSKHDYLDSLFYEGFVGVFVNKLNLRFPCFLETYSVYKYMNQTLYNKFKNNEQVTSLKDLRLFINSMTYKNFLHPEKVQESCKNASLICLLIQHIHEGQTLLKCIKDMDQLELVNYLYQIYSCLSVLSNKFTHYDLHIENVLLFNVTNSKEQYIKMVYHDGDEEIEVYTSNIAKMIDYGTSFFNDTNQKISTNDMRNIVYELFESNLAK